jgi:hypothetical protein
MQMTPASLTASDFIDGLGVGVADKNPDGDDADIKRLIIEVHRFRHFLLEISIQVVIGEIPFQLYVQRERVESRHPGAVAREPTASPDAQPISGTDLLL